MDVRVRVRIGLPLAGFAVPIRQPYCTPEARLASVLRYFQ
jgi:hypothetical protein